MNNVTQITKNTIPAQEQTDREVIYVDFKTKTIIKIETYSREDGVEFWSTEELNEKVA